MQLHLLLQSCAALCAAARSATCLLDGDEPFKKTDDPVIAIEALPSNCSGMACQLISRLGTDHCWYQSRRQGSAAAGYFHISMSPRGIFNVAYQRLKQAISISVISCTERVAAAIAGRLI